MSSEIEIIRELAWVQRNGWRVVIDDSDVLGLPMFLLQLNGHPMLSEPLGSLRECAVFIAGYDEARRAAQDREA